MQNTKKYSKVLRNRMHGMGRKEALISGGRSAQRSAVQRKTGTAKIRQITELWCMISP